MWKKSKQKQNQVRSHSNEPSVLLFDLAHKQCNGIVKGWPHCYSSEWKGTFFVNNILFGSVWCVVMAEIQLSVIKKKKDWTSKTLGNPLTPTSHNISVLPYILTTIKVDVICVSPLIWLQNTLNVRSQDTNVLKLLSMSSSSSLSSPSVNQCFCTLLRYIRKSLCTFALMCCNGNIWLNNSLKNSRCNHNHNNIPIDIKISLL